MSTRDHTVQVGPKGRLVLPARVRRQLGIEEGDRLALRVEDGEIVLDTRQAILERLRRRFQHVAGQGSAVDELIRERREEARRELEE